MTTQTEALKLALEALKTAQNNLAPSKGSAHAYGDGELWDKYADSITALEALAQPEQLERLQLIHKADIDLAKKRAIEAQPEQEPVAHSVVEPLRHDEYQRRVSVRWVNQPVAGPLYTTPPQRKPLVSLSDEDIERIAKKARSKDHAITLAMRELKEKNT